MDRPSLAGERQSPRIYIICGLGVPRTYRLGPYPLQSLCAGNSLTILQIHDIAKGIDYLHSRESPICHGDLKSVFFTLSDVLWQ